jgi:hypothetical protein
MKIFTPGWIANATFAMAWILWGTCSLAAAEVTEQVVATSFTNFAAKFPATFWRAGDAYFKSLGPSGHSQDFKSFTNDNKGTVRLLKVDTRGRWAGSLKLSSDNEPDDYWILSFGYRDGKWHTLAGAKYTGKSRIDLYEQQLGAPSMRPFVDKEIEKMQKE